MSATPQQFFADEEDDVKTPTAESLFSDEPTTAESLFSDDSPQSWNDLGQNALADTSLAIKDEKPGPSTALSRGADFVGDMAEGMFGETGRAEIAQDPDMGPLARAVESPVNVFTGMGETPMAQEAREIEQAGGHIQGIDPRLIEKIAGGIGRVLAMGPGGALGIGATEAGAKALDINQNEPGAFTEHPMGSAARVAVAGAIPGVSSKVGGVVAKAAADKFVNPLAQFAAGSVAGVATDLGLNEAQKGVEYLGSTDDPTMEGFGQALIPTKLDLAMALPGAVAGVHAASRAADPEIQARSLAGATKPKIADNLEAPQTRPMPEVTIEPSTVKHEVLKPGEAPADPSKNYYEYAPQTNELKRHVFFDGKWTEDVLASDDMPPKPIQDYVNAAYKEHHNEGQVIPDELRAREAEGQTGGRTQVGPEVLERPVISSSPEPSAATGGQGTSSDKYAGGLNKRLFGVEENPELQKVYENQELRNPPQPKGSTLAGVREEANKLPGFTKEQLAKIKKFDDARDFSQAETQAVSDQADAFAQKRLQGDLTPEDQQMFDELTRVTKIARGVRGSDLAVLNQKTVAKYVEQKNYKAAALKVLDDMDPSGKAPAKAIKAIREMPDDPLEMARTVFRESRRYHGVLQNVITANLLSNIFGTAPVNMASNIVNLMAETASRKPSEYAPAIAGAVRGSKDAASRTGFAFKEGFAKEALNDPSIAAQSPGFAFGGAKNPFNWGGRTAFAGDEFIKGVAEQSHIDVMAKAMAKERAGGDKAAQAALETELKSKPTPEMLKEAREYSKGVSYQMEPDEASGALGRFINYAIPYGKGTRFEVRPVRVVVPFFKTVLNVAKANVALSPLSVPGSVYKGLRGKTTPAQAVAQTAMGLIPTAIGLSLAQNGKITGPIPKDPAEREAFFAAGEKPWTFKVGTKRIPLAWAGPFALSLGLGAALKDAEKKQERGDIPEDAASLYAAAGMNAFKLFVDGSPIITLNSVLDLATAPDENKLKKLASNVGSSLVPLVSLQGFLNRQDIETLGINEIRDKYLRDKDGETAFEDVMNSIVDRTLFSRTLPKRQNQFGNEIQRPGQLTAGEPDKVYSEIYRLGVDVPQAGKSYTDPDTKKKQAFKPAEVREILSSGKPTYSNIHKLITSVRYRAMNDADKKEALEFELEDLKLDRKDVREDIKDRRSNLAGSVSR